MGDARQGRGRSEYVRWSTGETKMLIQLCGDVMKQGFCFSRGRISKEVAETKILPFLNERLKCQKSYKHYQSGMKFLRNLYLIYVCILHSNPKFVWDPLTKKLSAPDEVWEEYLRAHPNHKHICFYSCEEFESLQLIFRNRELTRSRTLKPRCSINAQIHEVKENEHIKEEVDRADETNATHVPIHNRISKDPLEKLHPGKRVRTDVCNGTRQTFALTQHREVEKKTDSVWDAIKNIPNLKDNVRYKALTLILKLEMKDIFMNMSEEDRLGWIRCNICNI